MHCIVPGIDTRRKVASKKRGGLYSVVFRNQYNDVLTEGRGLLRKRSPPTLPPLILRSTWGRGNPVSLDTSRALCRVNELKTMEKETEVDNPSFVCPLLRQTKLEIINSSPPLLSDLNNLPGQSSWLRKDYSEERCNRDSR